MIRTLALATVLVGSSLYVFGQDRSFDELMQIARDRSDPRPARTILLVGNSRTTHNAMPVMLRRIADSAGAPQKYETLTIAPNGTSFEELVGNWRVTREARGAWDDAIVQGESRGQSDEDLRASFMANGTRLIEELHPRDPTILIGNWTYDRAGYDSDETRADHYGKMQGDQIELARRTGAKLVNVGKVWEYLHVNLPGVALTEDGNHPTVIASYFVALCLYAHLSGGDVSHVTWAPDGVTPDQAADVRRLVNQYRAEL